jgi:hypothetical protein
MKVMTMNNEWLLHIKFTTDQLTRVAQIIKALKDENTSANFDKQDMQLSIPHLFDYIHNIMFESKESINNDN